MMKKQWLTLSLVFLLLACSKVQSTPVPIEVVRVTDTAVPPTPTATPLPTAAHTTIPTHTPSPTATPVPTETPTPAPTVPIWVAAGTAVPQPSAVIAPDNAAQVTELARWGRGVINDVAYSGDGRWIAVGTSTGVYIHDASDLNQAPLYLDTTFNAKLVDISSDGSRVAVALAGGTVQLWDVAQVEILYTKPQGASHLEFAPNGEVLAVVEGGNVAIWQVDSGEVLQAFSDVLGVDFSADSELLATWDYGSLSVYRWREGLLLEEAEPVDYFVSPHGEEFSSLISDVQFTPQSETLITTMPVNPAYSTTGDVGIQIGNDLLLTIPHIQKLASWPPITTGCDMTVFNADPPSSPDVWQIELSSDGQTFALVYDDHGYADDAKKYSSVQFYRLDSGSQQYMVDENILDMAIAPDGVTWVAGSQDGRLQIRRVSDGVVLDAFDGYESPVLDLAVSPDNQMVAITYLDEVKLYNAENGIVEQSYPAIDIAFAPDSATFAVGFADGHIELHSTADGTLLKTFTDHTDKIITLAFLPEESKLLSASLDCQLNVWDIANGVLVRQWENHIIQDYDSDRQVSIRVWHWMAIPEKQIIIGEFLHGAGVWQIDSGEFITAVDPPKNYPEQIAISPNGEKIAVAGSPLTAGVLSPAYQFVDSWQGGHAITAVAYSPDSQLLATGNDDRFVTEARKANNEDNGAIGLWNNDGQLLITLPTGTLRSTVLTFSPDGRFLATGSSDGTVRLWGIP